MTKALIQTLQIEYQELLALGATEQEAIEQLGIQNELHHELVRIFIVYPL